MGAIGAVFQALLRAGDHVVSSAFLFGNTNSLWQTVTGQGVGVSFVDATDVANVEAAITPATRIVFVETIANPRTQVADLARIGELCRERGILYIVDNTMTTPYLFRPKAVGAGLVVNALTKSIGGHGNALGGSLTDTGRVRLDAVPEHLRQLQEGGAGAVGHGANPRQGLARLRRLAGAGSGAPYRRRRGDHGLAHGPHLRECAGAGHACWRPTRAWRPCTTRAWRRTRSTRWRRELFRSYGSLFSFELKDGIDCFDFLNRLQAGHSGEQPGRHAHPGHSRRAHDLLRDGCRAPRQHGHRRVADPRVGRHRG